MVQMIAMLVWLEPLFINERQVKPLYIAVLDIAQLHISDFISDVLIIHVIKNIVYPPFYVDMFTTSIQT